MFCLKPPSQVGWGCRGRTLRRLKCGPPPHSFAAKRRSILQALSFHKSKKPLKAAFFGLFLASLICNTAAGLACGLARGLALAASAVLCAVAKALGSESLDASGLALALLVSDTAAGLACGLAGGLALAASAVLCAVAEALGIKSSDMFHFIMLLTV